MLGSRIVSCVAIVISLAFATFLTIPYGGGFTTSTTTISAIATSPYGHVAPESKSAGTRYFAPKTSCDSSGKKNRQCIFVTNLASDEVDVFSKSGFLIGTIDTGGESGYGVVYAGPTANSIYVFDYDLSKMYEISLSSLSVVNSFSCSKCIFGAYVPSTETIFITQFGLGEIIPFNVQGSTFGSEISVSGCGAYPEYIAYNGGDGKIFTACRSDTYAIITIKFSVSYVEIAGAENLNGVACVSGIGQVSGNPCWFDDGTTGYIYETTRPLTPITSCKFCNWGGAFNPANKEAYMASYSGSGVQAVSGDKPVKFITLNYGPLSPCTGPPYSERPASGTIVAPLTLSVYPGYTSGISATNSVLWTTQMGPSSLYPEGCTSTGSP